MLTTGPLNDLPAVRHGFFCRTGGVSEGLFSSLNCGYGSGDDKAKVSENRRRAMAQIDLEGERLVTAYQVHSPDVVEVRQPWAREEAPEADAMVTRTRGLALGILTADCVPVLFAEAEAGVVGAAHAGWKGALTGVVEATVAAMKALGAEPKRIVAGIGPAISQRSYEVGPEFPAPFLEQDARNADFFCPGLREGRFHFDLKGYVARRLTAAGLSTIQTLPCDTCAEDERFFSYRRACHRKETDYGRGLSAIYLEP
ncbi:MAG: peptidoglycan editing factor PgeF [Kiloniellaceae bacterium]|nr:peptidoglycan editing factor PgeF [Kiloniellaceae bacterium]